jgi:hypothetical protein
MMREPFELLKLTVIGGIVGAIGLVPAVLVP